MPGIVIESLCIFGDGSLSGFLSMGLELSDHPANFLECTINSHAQWALIWESAPLTYMLLPINLGECTMNLHAKRAFIWESAQ